MKENQIEKYCQFLRVIQGRLNEHFQEQKEYIHCKEGCAHCCKNGEYPCSELEFEFLKIGFSQLDGETQKVIYDNIAQLKKDRAEFDGEQFLYRCPFLINDRCSIYNFRLIICRTFGLAYYRENDKKKTQRAPFCMELGLNYGDVYDKKTRIFSEELFKKTGHKVEPVAYNTSAEFLMTKLGRELMDLDFGEEKTLIDWL